VQPEAPILASSGGNNWTQSSTKANTPCLSLSSYAPLLSSPTLLLNYKLILFSKFPPSNSFPFSSIIMCEI
jgi:hypothetical protein